jgi:biopolymer transport protein TolR
MGMNTHSNSGGTGKRRQTQTALSEINVTPLVDVMLVLLIVFMVSAPLMQQGLQVEVPKTSGSTLDESEEPIVLVINKQKEIHINKNQIPMSTLRTKLAAIYENKSKKEIFIQADQNVSYGFVAKVMAEVKQSGISKVGLVTEPGNNLTEP